MTQVSTISARRRRCGAPLWRVDTGDAGILGAAWCPDRARRAAARQPVVVRDAAAIDRALGRIPHSRLPGFIELSPREDAFAAGGERAEAMARIVRMILDADVDVALRTRGDTNTAAALVTLARRYGSRLAVTIGVFAADPDLTERWEPRLPNVPARLGLGATLTRLGVDVTCEIGPLLPFVNDSDQQLQALLRRVRQAGMTRVTPRWMASAPGLKQQVEREVSRSSARMMSGWLRQPDGGATIPLRVRTPRRQALQTAANAMGLAVVECACEQTGKAHSCISAPQGDVRTQLDLFSRSA